MRKSIVAGLATVAVTASMLAVAAQPSVQAATCPALPGSLPEAGSLPAVSEFPDPFKYWDGTRLSSPADWSCRRAQLRELLQYYEYGHLPPAPTSVTGTRNGNTLTVTVQANGRTASFNATQRLPSGNGPFPAIVEPNPLAARLAGTERHHLTCTSP